MVTVANAGLDAELLQLRGLTKAPVQLVSVLQLQSDQCICFTFASFYILVEIGIQMAETPQLAHREEPVDVAWVSVWDASSTPPWGGVPGKSHREESLGKTKETLDGLCFWAGLGTPWARKVWVSLLRLLPQNPGNAAEEEEL